MTGPGPRFGGGIPARIRVTVGEAPAPHASVLPVCDAPPGSSDLLADANGDPVWPIRTADERALLDAVAELFGTGVRSAEPARPRSGHDCSGEVVGVGRSAAAAELYAHLTGRRPSTVASVADLDAGSLPDVIVIEGPRLDPDLVQLLLTAPSREPATGLVWGRTRQQLRNRVLAYSASASLNGPVAKRRADVTAMTKRKRASNRHTERLSGAVPSDAVRRVATAGVGLLSIHSHGNGIRVALTPDLSLCGMSVPPGDGDRSSAPACFETGHCSMHDTSVAESSAQAHLLAPESMKARVLVLISCQAAFVGSRAIDSTWALLPRFLDSPGIGAVIASPELLVTSYDSISGDLLDQLAAGVPAGRALAGYERSPSAQQFEQRLLLFGDPGVRAAPGHAGKLALRRSRQAHRPPPAERLVTADPQLDLLRRVARQRRSDTRELSEKTAQRALEELDRYEAAVQAGAPHEHLGPPLRAAIVDHVAAIKNRAWTGWLADANVTREGTTTPCPHCAWPLKAFVGAVRSGGRRRFLSCPRCGDVVDQPVESSIGMTTALPRVELHGDVPTRDWTAAVVVIPDVVRDQRMHPWPALETGEPASSVDIPRDLWLSGPLVVAVVMVHGLALDVLAEAARLPPPG